MNDDPLRVWLYGRHIGSLRRIGRNRATNRFQFQYEPSVVESKPGRRLLSVALPVQSEPFNAELSQAWFDGLLPEGSMRTWQADLYDVPQADSFALLAAIGWDCAGAVSVLPEDCTPGTDATYQLLTRQDVQGRLNLLPGLPASDNEFAQPRSSLGGFQSKLLLRATPDGWELPLNGAVSTHILKPEPHHFPGLAAAEAWSLHAAGAVTPVAKAVVEAFDQPVLVVTRFDRKVDSSGRSIRVHQEDVCQGLGFPPERKYAKPGKGGPTFGAIASILRHHAADPVTSLLQLAQQLVVTVALGNADAHAKNFSLLHQPDGITMAPMYDVMPTLPFVPTQHHLGIPVATVVRLDRITIDHLIAEVQSWGLGPRLARAYVADTLQALAAALPAADQAYPQVRADVREDVRRRMDRLLNELETSS